ncbi:unnamed protein product [Durusdinium trenchii]
MDLDLQPSKSAEALEKVSQGAFSCTEEARHCWTTHEKNALRKTRLEAELRSLRSQLRQHQTRINAFVKEEQREKALTENLLHLQDAELQLGLPKLEIDHSKGVCWVGEPQDEMSEAEALGAIKISFDEEGTLLRAEPHPALGLSDYAERAVAEQDFAMLVTMVWSRLCAHSGLDTKDAAAHMAMAKTGGA